MAEIRDRGSVIATEEGSQILKTAKAAKRNYNGKPWTYRDIQIESGVSEKTIGLFFRQKQAIDESSARAICQALEVEFSRVVDIRPSENSSAKQDYEDRWQEVCRAMLDRQKQLSTNEVIASEAMHFDLRNDEIFVSLALVERKEADRLDQQVNPTKPVERYEEKTPIEYEVFREQVLRSGTSDRIAIVGEPGAGKTTLLQHIAFWILEQRLGLPIWISLGDLVKNGDLQRLKDYLTQVWLEDAISDVTQDVKSDFLEQLNKQRVWLLLDGVDEVVTSSSIELHEINNQLRNWLGEACIVLTCRSNIWDADINALRSFQTYRTKEFGYPTQVEQFIENGFCKSNQQSGQHLKTELAKPEQARLQQLIRNPLRLMMLCTTWHEHKSLPATKAELYQRFVDEFYKWNRAKWRKKALNFNSFPNTKLKQDQLNKALGNLACRALDEEASPFRLPHDLVLDKLGDPDEEGSNFWLALNLGWLQIARNAENTSEKVYIFFHPTFQEYFAALAINDYHFFLNHTPHNPDEGNYRIFESCWREVIMLWIGRDSIPFNFKDAFVEHLTCFDRKENIYWYKAYCLAAECMSEFLSKKYFDKVIDKIIEWSFGYFDLDEKKWKNFANPIASQARKSLEMVRNESVVHKLRKIVEVTPNENTLLSVTNFLCRFNQGKLIAEQILSSLLVSCKSVDTRRQAAKALYTIDSRNLLATRTLFDLVESDDYRTAALALNELITDKSQIINALEGKIKNFKKRNLNTHLLASTLHEIDPGSITAINTLIDLIKSLKNEFFCRVAIDELGNILEGTFNKEAIATLRNLIEVRTNGDDEFLRYTALINLCKIEPRNPDNLSKLIEIVFCGDDLCYWERLDGAILLMEIFQNEYVETYIEKLLKELIRENLHVKSFCILASEELAQIEAGRSFALKTLLNIIQSGHSSGDRTEAIHTLKKIINKEEYPTIIKIFKKHLENQVIKNDNWFYVDCYELLWHCTQNMSYPDFYRAWHEASSIDVELSENS